MNLIDLKYCIILTGDMWSLKIQVLKDLRKVMKGTKENNDLKSYELAHKFYWEMFFVMWYPQLDMVMGKYEDFMENGVYNKYAYPEIYGK